MVKKCDNYCQYHPAQKAPVKCPVCSRSTSIHTGLCQSFLALTWEQELMLTKAMIKMWDCGSMTNHLSFSVLALKVLCPRKPSVPSKQDGWTTYSVGLSMSSPNSRLWPRGLQKSFHPPGFPLGRSRAPHCCPCPMLHCPGLWGLPLGAYPNGSLS